LISPVYIIVTMIYIWFYTYVTYFGKTSHTKAIKLDFSFAVLYSCCPWFCKHYFYSFVLC